MEQMLTKCLNCTAPIDFRKAENGVIRCVYCGAYNTVPKKDVSPAALSFLRNGEADLAKCRFDDAYTAYAKAAEYDRNEPEAYWGMALAEFKVQYIKDTVNNRVQPICHEFINKPFTQNKNYLKALELATQEQRAEYAKRANEIDYIRSEFLKLQQTGLDYDCFICVKVSRMEGEQTDSSKKNWTDDAYDADAIYDLLKRNGFTPFFSEREIRGRMGADYEAMILYALYTSETMLIVCRNEEYLRTPWVKNEYTRFKSLVNDAEKENDSLTIVYKGTPIEKLPGSNGKIQGIDYGRREADFEIVKFVEKHTPLARAKREEEKRQKREREEEQKRRLDEIFEQQEKQRKEIEERNRILEERLNEVLNAKSSASNTTAMSSEELVAAFRKAQEEEQKKNKLIKKISTAISNYKLLKEQEERERRAREWKKIEAERKAREEAKRKAKIEAERKAREEQKRREEETPLSSFEIVGGVLERFIGNESNVVIPDCITSISNSAFKKDRNLISVTIPKSVKSIGNNAFYGCTNLTKITISNGVRGIGDSAFYDCRSLTSVTIPNSVILIGNWAFNNCSSLTSVVIPNSVKSIGDAPFAYCDPQLVIRCEANEEPEGWNFSWRAKSNTLMIKRYKVIWGCKGK